ncbi:bifunctional 2-polyprenyl-6-hydroxyphenol methylase/3-demethylubiquinol 3-O-methyltransferase UbiG [Geobacter sp. AOG1]|uniref:class I SAM-dependent methyltransferase n=1 Tax=Geobacter sp. AOG1 TaxID=1566346 RepID=UPI001CC810B7|nr:class I SAM-dependent methyltransferase [Geobacter sp. AOG1]GFE56650.1 SAM-dependent methyltransferase [Geobacter sp. AOG1]
MIQDPTDQYITTILARCDILGKDLLEIGCGKGRITRDLAKHARRVVASDPDAEALETARAVVCADNVQFVHAPTGMPDFPAGTFDLVIYTLSLHHVSVEEMPDSLRMAAGLLRKDGSIAVVEPGDGGSLTEAKERFGAGSGDERPAREAAVCAMHLLDGWTVGETVPFRTLFRFDDDEDFFVSMLPGYRQQPESFLRDVRAFLDRHRTGDGIILDADRRLNVLRLSAQREQP